MLDKSIKEKSDYSVIYSFIAAVVSCYVIVSIGAFAFVLSMPPRVGDKLAVLELLVHPEVAPEYKQELATLYNLHPDWKLSKFVDEIECIFAERAKQQHIADVADIKRENTTLSDNLFVMSIVLVILTGITAVVSTSAMAVACRKKKWI